MPSIPTDPVERMIWARREKLLGECRDRLEIFGPTVIRDVRDQPVDFDLIHLAWIAHIGYCWRRNLHAGIFSPHSSAGFIGVFAAWLLGQRLENRVKIVTNVDASAKVRFRTARNVLESPRYQKVFPEVRSGQPRWFGEHSMGFELPGQASTPVLESRGVSAKTAGAPSTHLLFDGVPDSENSATYERREGVKRLVDTVWLSRLLPGGNVLWLASWSSPDDASYWLRSRTDFAWLEQRIAPDGKSWEQEVYGAPPDYLTETRAAMAGMLGV